MPVTKTAKRSLRSSRRKEKINKSLLDMLEIAVRRARKTKKELDARKAFSIADRAKKKKVIHKNKAARIKSKIAKLVALPNKPKKQDTPRKNAAKK